MGYNVLICIDAEYALEISKNKESFPDRPQNGIIHYLPKGLLGTRGIGVGSVVN